MKPKTLYDPFPEKNSSSVEMEEVMNLPDEVVKKEKKEKKSAA